MMEENQTLHVKHVAVQYSMSTYTALCMLGTVQWWLVAIASSETQLCSTEGYSLGVK